MAAFDDRLNSVPPDIVRLLGQIDEVKGQWANFAGLSPQVLGRLKRSVLVTSTGASTRIEGAKLSDDEVEALMRGLSMQKMADRDAQEARGYYEVLQLVFDEATDLELTENRVKELHARLLRYATKDERHRGTYKTLDNSVEMMAPDGQVVGVLFATTPAYLTSKQMDELVAWTRHALAAGSHHPLLIIANFIVEFLKIHPFLDGNGRLSRVLTNLLMIQTGYRYMPFVSHEHLVEAQKSAYYVALRRSQITFGTGVETIQPWLEFFLRTCLVQAQAAMALVSADAVERLLSPSQLLVWRYLGDVVDAAPSDIARATGVQQRTVAQSLEKLMQLGKVERLGLGRATRYRRVAP
ncbi:Fic family protein [Actinosynnema sp. NPDC051121]